MSKRINVYELAKGSLQAIMAMETFGRSVDLDQKLKELIKIRASQLNGCAYCLDMHTEDALKNGETARRIFATSVWRESHLFSEKERALLLFVEEVTRLGENGVSDAAYYDMIKHFGDTMTANILVLICTINVWNRIAVATHAIYKD